MVKMVEMVHLQADAPHTYLRPQDTRAARRYNLSLHIIPGGTPADCALLTSMICFDDIESYSVDHMFPPIRASYPNQHIENEEFRQDYAPEAECKS